MEVAVQSQLVSSRVRTMPSGVSVICFAASYLAALLFEVVGLKVRFGWHRLVMLVFAVAGLVAHTWYLGSRAAASPQAPFATLFDWCLLAAWVLAVVYLLMVFYTPRSAVGLFVLPLTLVLIAAAQLASRAPFAAAETSRVWGMIHAGALLLGTVAVCIGFLAGLMYLIQSYRLKRSLPPLVNFRLPSLEWLERVNGRSLALSTLTMAVGFFSGVLLTNMQQSDGVDHSLWIDPVVLSLAGMLVWLVAAEVFRLVYPAARRGRKVAYLPLAAFVFLVLMFLAVTQLDTLHSAGQGSGERPPTIHGEALA